MGVPRLGSSWAGVEGGCPCKGPSQGPLLSQGRKDQCHPLGGCHLLAQGGRLQMVPTRRFPMQIRAWLSDLVTLLLVSRGGPSISAPSLGKDPHPHPPLLLELSLEGDPTWASPSPCAGSLHTLVVRGPLLGHLHTAVQRPTSSGWHRARLQGGGSCQPSGTGPKPTSPIGSQP